MRKPNFAIWVGVGALAAVSVGCSSGGSNSKNPVGLSGSSGNGGSSGSGSSGGSPGGSGSSGGSTSPSGSSSAGSGSSGAASSGAGGGSNSGSTMSGSGSSSGGAADGGTPSTTLAAYPSGPYCTPAGPGNGHLPDSPGCVLPPTIPPDNTLWMGYVDNDANELATMEPYTTYSFGDVFNYAQQNGKKYLMVNLAEFTCPGCGESAAEMSVTDDAGVTAAAEVVHAGGMVIEMLESVNFATAATQMQLQSWISDPTATEGPHAFFVTVVGDPPTSSGTPSFNFFGRRDQAYIVDLTTMTIVKYIDGSTGPTTNGTGNSGPQAMAYMHMLLGK